MRAPSGSSLRSIAAGLLLLPAPLALDRPAVGVSGLRDDRADVEAVVRALFSARAPRDPSIVSDTAEFTRPDGSYVLGREVIEQLQLLTEEYDVAVTTTIVGVQFTERRAAVQGRHDGAITPRRASAGGTKLHDRFLAVVIKESDGRWRIWQFDWVGDRADAAGTPRPEGLPPYLLAKAPRESALTREERRLRAAARTTLDSAARVREAARHAMGCDGTPNDDGFLRRDTLFATVGPLVRGPGFDPDRATLVMRDVLSHWRPPEPFQPPIVVPYMDKGRPGEWGIRFLYGDASLTLASDARVRSRETMTSSGWPAFDASVLAAIAATDSARTLPRGAADDTGTTYLLGFGFQRTDGISIPVLVVLNEVAQPFETVLPRGSSTVPIYPPRLRSVSIEGDVWIAFVVDPEGKFVKGTESVMRATHQEFAQAVLDFLPKVQYVPARLNGCRVGQFVQQAFSFRVKDGAPYVRGAPMSP